MMLSEVTLTTWLSIAAVCTAATSAAIACASFRLAKKSYSLAAQTADLSKPNLALYLIDSFRYRLKQREMTLYLFCLSIDNKSTIRNTIANVEMRVPYTKDDVQRLAVFSPANHFSKSENLDIKNIIQLPANIEARGSLTVNCCFEVPNEMLERAEFSQHILRFKSADGSFSELQRNLIVTLDDSENLAKKRISGIPI